MKPALVLLRARLPVMFAVLGLSVSLAACLQSSSSTMVKWWGPVPVDVCVILPVLPLDVSITSAVESKGSPYQISIAKGSGRNEERIAQVTNEVIDRLAGDPHEKIVSPGELSEVVAEDPRWRELRVYLDDPGPPDEPWKRKGLAELADLLGQARAARVRVEVSFHPGPPADAPRPELAARGYIGAVLIDVELLQLVEGERLGRGSGEGTFWLIYDPGSIFIYSKEFQAAVHHAVHAALTELFYGTEQPS